MQGKPSQVASLMKDWPLVASSAATPFPSGGSVALALGKQCKNNSLGRMSYKGQGPSLSLAADCDSSRHVPMVALSAASVCIIMSGVLHSPSPQPMRSSAPQFTESPRCGRTPFPGPTAPGNRVTLVFLLLFLPQLLHMRHAQF